MEQKTDIVVVPAGESVEDSKHGFKRGWGITGATVNSQNISMAYGSLPVGMRAIPHYHPFETALYIIKGRVRVFFGKNLDNYRDVNAEDFIYIPAGVIHSPENIGDIPMEFIVSRNAPEDIAIEV